MRWMLESMPTTTVDRSRSARVRQRKGRCTGTRRRLRNGHDGGGRRDVEAYIGIKTGSFPLEKGTRPEPVGSPFPCSLRDAAERDLSEFEAVAM